MALETLTSLKAGWVDDAADAPIRSKCLALRAGSLRLLDVSAEMHRTPL